MELLGAMLISGAVGLGIAFVARDAGQELSCPECAHSGRGLIEEARVQLGWNVGDGEWWPTYGTRHHYRCEHCGHMWAKEV
jgi:hypothetical protein